MTFRLSKKQIREHDEMFTAVEGKLEDFQSWLGERRDEYAERSDKWQESDRAMEVSDWLDDIEYKLEAFTSALNDFREIEEAPNT